MLHIDNMTFWAHDVNNTEILGNNEYIQHMSYP